MFSAADASRILRYIGSSSGSNGTVNVDGSLAVWNCSGDLYVGDSGLGTLNIDHGGLVNNSRGYIGRNNSTNVVTVDGQGNVPGILSQWANADELNIGYSGMGKLNLYSGGIAQNSNGYVGRIGGSTGTANVEGPGSLWKNLGELSVGQSGNGTLSILSGGRVESTNGYVSNFSGSSGTVNVGGLAVWKNSGKLEVGSSGAGTLSISAGALVENTDAYIHHFSEQYQQRRQCRWKIWQQVLDVDQ